MVIFIFNVDFWFCSILEVVVEMFKIFIMCILLLDLVLLLGIVECIFELFDLEFLVKLFGFFKKNWVVIEFFERLYCFEFFENLFVYLRKLLYEFFDFVNCKKWVIEEFFVVFFLLLRIFIKEEIKV